MSNRFCSKITFTTKKAAQYEVKLQESQRRHFSKRTNTKKNNKKLRIYQCPRCRYYHLTTQKPRNKK